MARLLRISAAFGALALAAQLPAQQIVPHDAVSGTPQDVSTAEGDKVGFKDDAHERMTVAVRVAGTGPYRFLVDTGADRTAISSDLAAALKLEKRSSARVHSVTGVNLVETVRVPLIELGRNRLERLDAPLLDRRHMGADGILGVDSLRSQRVVFDFKANALSIVPTPRRPLAAERDAIVVRAKARMGHLILSRATVNGRRVNLIVDTGAEISIGNQALRNLLGLSGPKEADSVELLSVTGAGLDAHYALIDTLDLGGATLKSLPIVFADAHTFRKLELDDRPTLLLGMNAMRAFDLVSIDFAQKKLRVVLPKGAAAVAVAPKPARGAPAVEGLRPGAGFRPPGL